MQSFLLELKQGFVSHVGHSFEPFKITQTTLLLKLQYCSHSFHVK